MARMAQSLTFLDYKASIFDDIVICCVSVHCNIPLLRLRTDGSGEKEKIRNALKRE